MPTYSHDQNSQQKGYNSQKPSNSIKQHVYNDISNHHNKSEQGANIQNNENKKTLSPLKKLLISSRKVSSLLDPSSPFSLLKHHHQDYIDQVQQEKTPKRRQAFANIQNNSFKQSSVQLFLLSSRLKRKNIHLNINSPSPSQSLKKQQQLQQKFHQNNVNNVNNVNNDKEIKDDEDDDDEDYDETIRNTINTAAMPTKNQKNTIQSNFADSQMGYDQMTSKGILYPTNVDGNCDDDEEKGVNQNKHIYNQRYKPKCHSTLLQRQKYQQNKHQNNKKSSSSATCVHSFPHQQQQPSYHHHQYQHSQPQAQHSLHYNDFHHHYNDFRIHNSIIRHQQFYSKPLNCSVVGDKKIKNSKRKNNLKRIQNENGEVCENQADFELLIKPSNGPSLHRRNIPSFIICDHDYDDGNQQQGLKLKNGQQQPNDVEGENIQKEKGKVKGSGERVGVGAGAGAGKERKGAKEGVQSMINKKKNYENKRLKYQQKQIKEKQRLMKGNTNVNNPQNSQSHRNNNKQNYYFDEELRILKAAGLSISNRSNLGSQQNNYIDNTKLDQNAENTSIKKLFFNNKNNNKSKKDKHNFVQSKQQQNKESQPQSQPHSIKLLRRNNSKQFKKQRISLSNFLSQCRNIPSIVESSKIQTLNSSVKRQINNLLNKNQTQSQSQSKKSANHDNKNQWAAEGRLLKPQSQLHSHCGSFINKEKIMMLKGGAFSINNANKRSHSTITAGITSKSISTSALISPPVALASPAPHKFNMRYQAVNGSYKNN